MAESQLTGTRSSGANKLIIALVVTLLLIVGWIAFARKSTDNSPTPTTTYPSSSNETTSNDPNKPTQGVNSNGNGTVPGTNGIPSDAPTRDQ